MSGERELLLLGLISRLFWVWAAVAFVGCVLVATSFLSWPAVTFAGGTAEVALVALACRITLTTLREIQWRRS